MLRKILVSGAILALTGCYTLKFNLEYEDPEKVQMTPAKNARLAKHFVESRMVWHVAFGLIPLSQANITAILQPYLKEGRRISNLKIRTSTWLDFGVASLTQIEVEGDSVIPR